MTAPEVYPNAPAVLVAVEVRHPHSDLLSGGEQGEIKRALTDLYPISQPLAVKNIIQGPSAPATVEDRQIPRYAARDLMTAVTFNEQAIALETTSHRDFPHLMSLLRVAVEARHVVRPLEALMRVGLRYIDEIRVPDLPGDLSDWSQWVDCSLIGPTEIASDLGLRLEQSHGIAAFDRGEGRKLVTRFGPAEGYAIAPGGLLQRPSPPPGPFFLFDIDSYWVPVGAVPPFDVDEAIRIATDLHEPVSSLFERMITPRLRDEVLRDA